MKKHVKNIIILFMVLILTSTIVSCVKVKRRDIRTFETRRTTVTSTLLPTTIATTGTTITPTTTTTTTTTATTLQEPDWTVSMYVDKFGEPTGKKLARAEFDAVEDRNGTISNVTVKLMVDKDNIFIEVLKGPNKVSFQWLGNIGLEWKDSSGKVQTAILKHNDPHTRLWFFQYTSDVINWESAFLEQIKSNAQKSFYLSMDDGFSGHLSYQFKTTNNGLLEALKEIEGR